MSAKFERCNVLPGQTFLQTGSLHPNWNKCLSQGCLGLIFGLLDETGDSDRSNHNGKSCWQGQRVSRHLGVVKLQGPRGVQGLPRILVDDNRWTMMKRNLVAFPRAVNGYRLAEYRIYKHTKCRVNVCLTVLETSSR